MPTAIKRPNCLMSAENLWTTKGNAPHHQISQVVTKKISVAALANREELPRGSAKSSDQSNKRSSQDGVPIHISTQLNASGEFWNKVQTTCVQTISSVRWNSGESHWYFPTCKSHTFQAVLRHALSEEGSNLKLTGA